MSYVNVFKNLLLDELKEAHTLCLKELKKDSDIKKLQKAIKNKEHEISMMNDSFFQDYDSEVNYYCNYTERLLRNQKDNTVLDRCTMANEILLKTLGSLGLSI